MAGGTFKEWLGERVGDGTGKVSRRELARRLADKPHAGDVESHRSSLRRILRGERVASQPTRDAIQAALEDWSAPSVDSEDSDTGISHEEMSVWQRVNRKLAMRVV